MNYLLTFCMCLTPGISLTLWGSPLEQESYLSYIKRVIKRHCKPQTHLNFEFKLQNLHFNSQILHAKILDIIIGEKQSAAIRKRTILHTLSIICDSIDL